jgi:hypothetical protein
MSTTTEKLTDHIGKYLIGGFTLIPALAWNDLIRFVFERIAPVPLFGGIVFKTIYVIVISILTWICVQFVGKISGWF